MAIIPQGGGGGAGGAGWIKIADVTVPGGVADEKTYQDPPNNTVIQTCRVSSLNIELLVRAGYPIVDIGGSTVTLSEATDQGHYEGTIPVTITGSGPLTITSLTANNATGAEDTVDLTYESPPELLTLSFTGGYPGSQTELKAGDTFQLIGTTDKSADAIEIQNFGAMDLSVEAFASGTGFTVTGTIADQGTTLQALSARARARSSVNGAYGSIRDTNLGGGSVDGTDLVNLNNTYPTVSFGSPAYPGGQQALKASEQSTVVMTTANLDTIAYDSPNGDLSIQNPSLDETPKTVTRIGGLYNISTDNLRATANRAANDATTAVTTIVNIASVAATVSIELPASRLRSGGNDGTSLQSHIITIQSDQNLLNAPAIDPGASGGAWTGSWAGGPQNWTRYLDIHDDDPKGSYSWQNLVATNLAGLVTNTITGVGTYDLGGFVSRTLTFAAFATTTLLDVEVVDFAKLQAGIFTATNQAAQKQAIGTPPPVTDGYTIVATGVKPTTLTWLDAVAASSNSGGTATITDVEEVV